MCIWCTVSEWNQCLELCSDLPKAKPAVRFLNMNSNIPHQIPPRLSEPNIHFRAMCVYCISVWVTILSISKGLLGETCKTILILHVEITEISIKSHHDQPVSSRSFSLGLCVLVNHVTENQLVQTSCPIMLLCEQTLLLPPALLCDLTSSYWWINWNGVTFSSAHPVSTAPSIQMNWDEWTRHSERKKNTNHLGGRVGRKSRCVRGLCWISHRYTGKSGGVNGKQFAESGLSVRRMQSCIEFKMDSSTAHVWCDVFTHNFHNRFDSFWSVVFACAKFTAFGC